MFVLLYLPISGLAGLAMGFVTTLHDLTRRVAVLFIFSKEQPMPFCFALVLTIHITISVSMLLPFWSSMTPFLFIPPLRFATGGGSFAGGVSAQLGDAVYLRGTPWG